MNKPVDEMAALVLTAMTMAIGATFNTFKHEGAEHHSMAEKMPAYAMDDKTHTYVQQKLEI